MATEPLHVTAAPPLSVTRLLKWGAAVLVCAGAAYLVWLWAHDMSGIRREAPKIPAIIPLPPPPPPPPPKDPEPPVEEKIVTPAPQPEPEPVKPQEAPPSPAADLSNPMQMDGDPQNAGDAFNIGAGKGGGLGGSGAGLGNGTYNQYLAYAFQRVLRDNPQVRNLAFRLQADVWLSASGEITRVELAHSSGDGKTDELVLAALRTGAPLQQRPPATITLPLRIDLSGRRPG